MSFSKMKRDDLYELATENFGVEVSETANKEQVLAALVENGVTWDMAVAFDKNAAAVDESEEVEHDLFVAPTNVITSAQAQQKEVKVVEEEDVEFAPVQVADEVVLIKMDRENPRYDVRGYKFTEDSPFALVKAADVDFILTHEEGFKQASPREAKEFYG